MPARPSKTFVIWALLTFSFVFWHATLPAVARDTAVVLSSDNTSKGQNHPDRALPEIPRNIDSSRIGEIVKGLSDDQVRRLLIQELERSVPAGPGKDEAEKRSGFARIIQNVEENVNLFHKRLSEVHLDVMTVLKFIPQAASDLSDCGGGSRILLALGAIVILLAGGLGAEWLFGRTTAAMGDRLTASHPVDWTGRIKRLFLFAAMDFMSMILFCASVMALFFVFFNTGSAARLSLMTSLVVVLTVRMIRLLARFLLAPKIPSLRLFFLDEETANDLYRWITRIVLVLGAGFLVGGLLELQGISLEADIFVHASTSAMGVAMIITLVLKYRESLTHIICQDVGGPLTGIDQLRAQLASYWPLLVIPYLLVSWVLYVFYLLVGRSDLVVPILATIYSIPVFLVLEGVGRRLLSAMFGLVEKPGSSESQCEPEVQAEGDRGAGEDAGARQEGQGVVPLMGRLLRVLRCCLSISIAGLIFFGLLRFWGFDVDLGEEITEAAFEILLVVSLAFVAWSFISEALSRKIREVQGSFEVDADSDQGSTGGSRLGTLLQILRKFLLVMILVVVGLIILSTLGIDIHPLLAGAGILGLAIGLGTQSLIKDIVSGLFFLIDDAFRIGDSVESGKAKGTVEAISIRSLKLRHPRGMVHNVPFSQLGMVTNFSRDYTIVKLDFRVPFGTDFDRVRKVVKQINKEIQEDEEYNIYLLGPIKFAGVLAFDDSALIMRVKFKSKPGLQFLVQRQVLRRLQELFRERGLEFATRHVMVRMPEDWGGEAREGMRETPPGSDVPPVKPGLSAAAGAALAVAMVDEETRRRQAEEKTESE